MANPLYVPLNVDPTENGGRLTVPWRQFFQSLNQNIGPMTGAITELTGDVTATGPGSVAATIANDAVTYAKMQNVSAASRLLGRGSASGAGNVEEITVSTGLTMTGTTLTATGAGGTVTNTGTLTDHAVIVGNGGVDVSALASLGTTTTVLHGNASGDPTFGAVSLTADVSGILPVANGGSGIADGASIKAITITLTDAQIKALPTTAFPIIAAPGVNLMIEPVFARVYALTTAGAYTNINAGAWMTLALNAGAINMTSFIPNDASITVGSTTRVTDLLGGASRKRGTLVPWVQTENVADWGPTPIIFNPGGVANTSLDLQLDNGGSGDLTGGNAANTLAVFVLYVILPTVV